MKSVSGGMPSWVSHPAANVDVDARSASGDVTSEVPLSARCRAGNPGRRSSSGARRSAATSAWSAGARSVKRERADPDRGEARHDHGLRVIRPAILARVDHTAARARRAGVPRSAEPSDAAGFAHTRANVSAIRAGRAGAAPSPHCPRRRRSWCSPGRSRCMRASRRNWMRAGRRADPHPAGHAAPGRRITATRTSALFATASRPRRRTPNCSLLALGRLLLRVEIDAGSAVVVESRSRAATSGSRSCSRWRCSCSSSTRR